MLDSSDIEFLLGSLQILRPLEETDLRLIADSAYSMTYRQGEIIVNSKKECNGPILVKSGQLRAFFEAEDGKELTLYRLLSRDACILTASCILKNISFNVMLEVEKDSVVYFIPPRLWSRISDRYPSVREFSSELVYERFSEVMWIMEQMVSKNMGQRVASFLMEQYVLEESETLQITHETIARNLGTAREVVSRILKYLENDGLLRLSRGQITLSDIPRLRQMCR